MNDVDTLSSFLTEVLATPEESGGASIVTLTYKMNGGLTEQPLHTMRATGGGTWGQARAMADALWSIARRHCAGIAAPGGAHQLMLDVCYGTETKPRRFLPFYIMAAPQIAPGMMTEQATPGGVLAQSMRLSEELVKGSFKQNSDTMSAATTIIDRSMRRQAELEHDNRELFTALKLVVIEFDKQSHERRMQEIAALRSAQFQKKMQDLLPVLVNMIADGTFPDSVEEQSIADAISSALPKSEAEAMLAGLAAKPNGVLLAGALQKKLQKAYERQDADRDADDRLLREVPLRSFSDSAENAAGRAVRVVRDQAAPKQIEAKKSNGDTLPASEQPAGSAEKLRSLLFQAVPDAEQLAGLTAMLRMKGATELADEMERQFKECR